MLTMNERQKETKKHSEPSSVRNQRTALIHYPVRRRLDFSRDPAPGDIPAIAFM